MLRTPMLIQATLSARRNGEYAARVVGWGILEGGRYGSLWTTGIPLGGVSAEAPAREVLRVFARALLEAIGPEDEPS